MKIIEDRFEWSTINPSQKSEQIRSQLSSFNNTNSDITEDFISAILKENKGILVNYEGGIETFLNEDIPFLKHCSALIALLFVSVNSSLLTVDTILRHVLELSQSFCDLQFGFELYDVPEEIFRIELLGIPSKEVKYNVFYH